MVGAGAPEPRLRLAAPDLRPWLGGNVLPGVWSFDSGLSGPHLVLSALVHGNEIAGAIVLDKLLRQEVRPERGRLTFVFANLDAFSRFDPDDPTASRFLEEDLNRLWSPESLDGPRRSAELRRARLLRPVLDAADILLDLHSMLWPSDPLFLVGGHQGAARLALSLGRPPLVVADSGHEAGRRMIDYGPLATDPARRGLLLEAGWHWQRDTVRLTEQVVRRVLAAVGVIPGEASADPPGRFARVTRTVTARTSEFTFLRPWRGGEIVPARNTLIALDGEEEIRTPHDDCLLVMPSLVTLPGHTAVRMARFEEG
ncbi:MAG: succinylglutamate desuccinylase/aspartoacylase family protein [Acetobacteraceae bacterium]|nr:succinylglutamate desuccinylase/aspartoacylase family protein [Acetobacteraceae bacterium]